MTKLYEHKSCLEEALKAVNLYLFQPALSSNKKEANELLFSLQKYYDAVISNFDIFIACFNEHVLTGE